jgi:putative photosynthetic complex assembly protein
MSHPAPLQAPAAAAPGDMPRGLLLAVGALLALTLLAVALLGGTPREARTPDAAAVATRLLRFDDGPDGSVAVFDAKSGALLRNLQGEQGFVRGALRALARERRAREIGPQPPFELAARADGRLTLTDTATGARVDLESFGPTNAAAFARLLTLPASPGTP